ncbi:unnamed protein product [Ceratitis capitata]|uniref:(Mediterranean fruit fly) hypothetical protein n=1 Tax=Ceratitis capitata TaxID=7213 RepID=A0A811U4F3_CERCA|nr:unnamed protein product [Ceratitis capitata]
MSSSAGGDGSKKTCSTCQLFLLSCAFPHKAPDTDQYPECIEIPAAEEINQMSKSQRCTTIVPVQQVYFYNGYFYINHTSPTKHAFAESQLTAKALKDARDAETCAKRGTQYDVTVA